MAFTKAIIYLALSLNDPPTAPLILLTLNTTPNTNLKSLLYILRSKKPMPSPLPLALPPANNSKDRPSTLTPKHTLLNRTPINESPWPIGYTQRHDHLPDTNIQLQQQIHRINPDHTTDINLRASSNVPTPPTTESQP